MIGNISKSKGFKGDMGDTPSIVFTYDEETGELFYNSDGILLDKDYVASQNLVAKETTDIMKSDIEGLRQHINEESHFRGYFRYNADIVDIPDDKVTPNDFAYSAESGTKWIYDEQNGWQDSGTPVPDQLTPASETTPLINGEASVGTESAYARGDHRHPTDTTRASATELNLVKQTLGDFSNAVKETITGVYLPRLVLEDVSPVEHIVKIKISSPFSTVENTKLYVTDENGDVTEYIPNIDGSVDVLSVAPVMRLFVESTRVLDGPNIAEIEYNKDLNKTLSSMNEATEELQKPHTAELIETITASGQIPVYTFNRDANGNTYNFKAMYVHIAIKPTVSNRLEVSFYTSDFTRLCSYLFTNTAGNNGFMSIHADVIGGMWQAIATSATSQGAPTAVQMWGENLIPYSGERIGMIDIKGATSAIASGATITIYGVR